MVYYYGMGKDNRLGTQREPAVEILSILAYPGGKVSGDSLCINTKGFSAVSGERYDKFMLYGKVEWNKLVFGVPGEPSG